MSFLRPCKNLGTNRRSLLQPQPSCHCKLANSTSSYVRPGQGTSGNPSADKPKARLSLMKFPFTHCGHKVLFTPKLMWVSALFSIQLSKLYVSNVFFLQPQILKEDKLDERKRKGAVKKMP